MSRALRLASLLRNFGVAGAENSAQDPKALISALRTEYFRRAKEEHPDLVPAPQREAATQKFQRMNQDYEEAMKLLQMGISPGHIVKRADGHYGWQPADQSAYQRSGVHPAYRYQHSKPQEFSLETRLKGIASVLFVGCLFIYGMREFLVASAGRCMTYTPPLSFHPLETRRHRPEWKDTATCPEQQAKAAAEKARKAEVAARLAEKKDRGVDEFYQKRGISNVKKKHSPRGHGDHTL